MPKAESKKTSMKTLQLETFQAWLDRSFESLPTTEKMTQADDIRPHEHSKLLAQAAEILGNVRDQLERNKNRAALVAQFYDRCARANGLPRSLRAVCLRNLIDLTQTFSLVSVDLIAYDPSIGALAQKLPSEPFRGRE